MSPEEIERITSIVAKEAAKEAVHEVLTSFGFNTSTPTEVQRDILYLRNMRQGGEEMKKWARRSAIAVFIPGCLYIFWEALKQSIKS